MSRTRRSNKEPGREPPGTDLAQRLIDLLRRDTSGGLRRCEIRRELGLETNRELTQFRDVFRDLDARGVILRQRRNRYVLAQAASLVPGTVAVHARGFGFVTPADGSPDIFVPPRALGGAISGDHVLVDVNPEADERGPTGTVRRIVHRPHAVLTGRLIEVDGDVYVRPLRRDLPERIPVVETPEAPALASIPPGAWVVAQLLAQRTSHEPLRATLVRCLNSENSVAADLDAIVNEYELPPPYSAAQCESAARLTPTEVPREDCRHLTVVTIDPEDAKDFDDALSVEPGPTPDTVRVGVHIADVAAYIPPGGALDAQARERSFTAYLPGRTLPMLPRPIASDRCSLLAGAERLAHTVFLDIAPDSGRVLATRRAHTLIRVSRRFTFEEVQRFLADGHAPECTPAVRDTLEALAGLYPAMRRRRAETEAFMELSIPEVRVRCQEDPPCIQGLTREDPNAAHQLVEEFMLAANVAVGRELADRRIPGLFRVHAEPSPGDLAEFVRWATPILGFRPGHLDDRAACNRLMARIAESPVHDIVASGLLCAMQRAAYAATPQLHYGLGKECYSHFTSPIRRYPDLLVHQQLLAADLGLPGRDAGACDEAARHCTEREQNNDEAYYAATDRLKLRHLQELTAQDREQFYEGLVARILADGPLVHIAELGMFGLVPKNRLAGDGFRHDREAGTLRDRHSGKTYKCGDVMYIQVRKADTTRGTLLLEPVQPRPAAGRPRKSRKERKDD